MMIRQPLVSYRPLVLKTQYTEDNQKSSTVDCILNEQFFEIK